MTKNRIVKWVDKDFGVGGASNYEREQVVSAIKAVLAFMSVDFAIAERESLAKLFNRLSEMSQADFEQWDNDAEDLLNQGY